MLWFGWNYIIFSAGNLLGAVINVTGMEPGLCISGFVQRDPGKLEE